MSSPQAARTPLTTFSRGSSVPITPVEATATWPGSTPSSSAAAACIAAAVSRPRCPSPTFEQPELAATARRPSRRASSRDDHRGAHAGVRREAGGGHGAGRVRRHHSDIEALRLDPRRDPGGPKPAGSDSGASSVTCWGASTHRDVKNVTRGPPSPAARASGSGPARPAPPRPSRGCRSPRARSRGRPPRSRGCGSGSSRARRRCPAARPRAR